MKKTFVALFVGLISIFAQAQVETASADPFALFPTVSIGFSMAL